MRSSRHSILFALFTAAAALSPGVPAALAQHSHDDKSQPGHKHDGHSHGEIKVAADFGAAMKEIGERMSALDALLAKADLDEAHEQSDVIGALAKSLGALALKADSGVDKAQVKDANKTGKALAEAADGIHDAAEKKDLAAAKAAYAEMKKQADALAAFAPAKYFCPMHCEGAKTSDKPGTCPVCNMNLKKQTSDTFTVDIKPVGGGGGGGGGAITAGKPTTLVFTIKDPTGLPVTKLETVHEKLLHLLMVSKDLSWYAHEHPEIQPDGTFTFTYTFPQAGEFFFYNDFTPPSVGQQVVAVPVTVAGTAPAAKRLVIDADKPKTIDGYTVSLDTGGPIKTGGSTHLSYTLTKDGKPVTTLQPYLGAMGHLVIISEDRTQFVHSHPHEGGEHATGGMGGPKVDFEAHFTVPGTYKGWAQFNVGTPAKEQVITAPFTFKVEKGDGKDAGKDGHTHGAKPVNSICPITGEVADAALTRDFKGQVVGFHDAASATAWDGLKDKERMSKFVAALAAAVPAGHDDGMPDGLADAEARELYLTPGGLYTEADIKANGSVTAGAKFKGVMSKHDFKPKAGDAICPITLTKVNPQFTWIIGGKTYQFCCPPCIDEFVLLAKTSPEQIKDPSFYVKK